MSHKLKQSWGEVLALEHRAPARCVPDHCDLNKAKTGPEETKQETQNPRTKQT